MTYLPRQAYTTQEWIDRERMGLFSKTWVFAGEIADVENPGDYSCVQAGEYPLVVIRMSDGTLGAFHNVCRHRGTVLLEGRGNTGTSVICPYHRWTYGLDGELKAVPNMAACFPDLDRKNLSLKDAAIGVIGGLIFANADPQVDFDHWIEPIADKVWPHDLAAKDINEAASLIYDLKCDWKVFVENAIDAYHLAYLHKNTLGGPKPEENVWERHGDHLLWYATDGEAENRYSLPIKSRKEFKSSWAKPLAAAQADGFAGVYHLFPATLIAATPYTFSVSTLHAISPGRSRMNVRHWVGPRQSSDERKYVPGYDKKTGIISSDNWTQPALETGDFQTEDVWICEKIQSGLQSPAFERGPLAQGAGAEDPIGWFHEALMRSN